MIGQPRTRLIPGLAQLRGSKTGFSRLARFILGGRHSRQATQGWGGGRPRAVSSHRSAPGISGAISAAVSVPRPPYCVITCSVAVRCSEALAALRMEVRVADESRNWSLDTEELAACFTVHARGLFGYACVLSGADQAAAGDMVQGAFEAASLVWRTLRDLPAYQCDEWLLESLATTAQRRTGHPAGGAFVSPSHRQLTELNMARFGAEFDAVAGLDRFADWLRSRPDEARPGNGDGDESRESAGAGVPRRAMAGPGELPGLSRLGRAALLPVGTGGPAGAMPGPAEAHPATPEPAGPDPATPEPAGPDPVTPDLA